MAIPVPRSFQQILNDAIDNFTSDYDVPGLKVGGPLLSIFETFVASDVRDTQDIFDLLAAIDINSAEDTDLDNAGADENAPRLPALASNGLVNILDTSFTKVATKIYQGQPAPVTGSTTIYVVDASDFPATGSIYIGRGTTNLEGPLAYTNPTLQGGGYYSLTVSGGTQRFHNLSETVILAQGGNRLVAAGTVVQTRQGNAIDAVSFTTVQSVTLLDGETVIENVPVVCQEVGIIGNAPAGAISVVSSPAFNGMGVINPKAISNGVEQEDDSAYKERIKDVRASRSKGTTLAIQTGVLGITALDEAATVQSASVVRKFGKPTTLYIDDGTGYEDKTAGAAIESIFESANGGEEIFYLAKGRPVAKAFVETSIPSPFSLVSGCKLACMVGGTRSEHTFDSSMFSDISSVTAYELVAAINSNPDLLFSARVSSSAQKVSIFAKAEVNEDVQVVDPVAGTSANTFLGFPIERVDTLKLYLNDRLLYKDGLSARLVSNPTIDWAGFAEGDTLILSVDGTDEVTYTFTGQDFIDADTGYTTVAESNSLDSWAAVFNAKIPGITASVSSEQSIEIVSNLGPSDRASLAINPDSALVSKGMWSSFSAEGANSDYTLDRNFGQVVLGTVLEEEDSLSVGTLYTRGYVQSSELGTLTFTGDGGNIYVAVDGAATVIQNGITASTHLKVTTGASSPIKRFEAYTEGTLTTKAYPFLNIRAGDFSIAWDPAFVDASPSTAAALMGIWRVCNVDPLGQWFEIDTDPVAAPGAPGYFTLTDFVDNGITFCRSNAVPQVVNIPAGSYAPSDIVAAVNDALEGARASTYRTDFVRLTTNTYGANGDISFLSADAQGQTLGFAQELSTNSTAHIAVVESGNSEVGTPGFNFANVTDNDAGPPLTFELTQALSVIGGYSNSIINWVKALPTPNFLNRYGSNAGDRTSIVVVSGTEIEPRSLLAVPVVDTGAAPNNFTGDRLFPSNPFGLSPFDTINITLDRDSVSKGYAINTFRRCEPDSNVPYGTSIELFDSDNADAELTGAFGQTFKFDDFAVYMRSRFISHKGSATKALLWRYSRFGPEGNEVKVRYTYPTAPDLDLAITTTENAEVSVSVALPSGADVGITVSASDKLAAGRVDPAGLEEASSITYFSGVRVEEIERVSGTVTATLAMPTADVTDHQYQNGDSIYLTSNHADFPSGFKTITRNSTTEIEYTEAGADASDTFDPETSALMFSWTNTPLDLTGVAVGQIVTINSSSSLNTSLEGTFRVYDAGDKLWFQVHAPNAAPTQFAYANLNVANAVVFYPLADNTVTAISSAINDLESIVTTTLIGDGSGSITKSTSDEWIDEESTNEFYDLTDGINYVSETAYNALTDNLTLTLKNATSSNLTSPNDWANEEIRLVPETVKNISDYLNIGLVTGLSFGGGRVEASSNNGKLQLSSITPGSEGGVQVLGGSANSLAVPVLGAATLSTDDTLIATVETSDVQGLSANQWVSIDNTQKALKTLDWTSSTTLTIGADGKVTVAGAGSAWRRAGSITDSVVSGTWNVEKHGKFVAYVLANSDQTGPSVDFTTVKEGDYAVIQAANGEWSKLDALNAIRDNTATATLLQDGTILVTGGVDSGGTEVATVEIYDPETDTWTNISATDPLPAARFGHTATLLDDGRVLVVGGMNGGAGQSTVWAYNPTNGSGAKWSVMDPLNQARAFHTTTSLENGTVLVTGGETNATTQLDSCELYNIDDDSWLTLGATLDSLKSRHTATLMADGNVLLANGYNDGDGALSNSDIYNTATQSITTPADTGTARYRHTATLLPSGKVLVAGGWTGADGLVSCKLFDPAAGTWANAAALPQKRSSHAAVLLEDEDVLVTGGIEGASTKVRSCLRYDYVTDSWSYTGGLSVAKYNMLLLKLEDGEPVVVGGTLTDDSDTTIVEIFNSDEGLSAVNSGTYRVVRAVYSNAQKKWAFWIENDNAIEESATISSIAFLDRNSFIPGDTLSVGVLIAALGNQGLWTVESIDPSNPAVMYLQGEPTATSGAASLSTNYVFLQGIDGSLSRLIKKILWIAPHIDDPDFSSVAFATNSQSGLINAAYGSIINALDKLDFTTSLDLGVDGYKYNTGLIAEANKVLYGVSSDPNTYPGIVAAGDIVNVQGPIVKRISVSIALKLRSGVGSDVLNRVRSEVTAVINNTKVGEDIAISDIIVAAAGVAGVMAVSILNPTFSSTSDVINVQPYEKPLVIDPEVDVAISIAGG